MKTRVRERTARGEEWEEKNGPKTITGSKRE